MLKLIGHDQARNIYPHAIDFFIDIFMMCLPILAFKKLQNESYKQETKNMLKLLENSRKEQILYLFIFSITTICTTLMLILINNIEIKWKKPKNNNN